MKKLFSMMACCAFLALLAGCGGCCEKKGSKHKSHKKSMSHKGGKSMQKSHGKKKVSEAEKVWDEVRNMWVDSKL